MLLLTRKEKKPYQDFQENTNKVIKMEEKNLIIPILQENRKLKLKLDVAIQGLQELESEPRGVAKTTLAEIDNIDKGLPQDDI